MLYTMHNVFTFGQEVWTHVQRQVLTVVSHRVVSLPYKSSVLCLLTPDPGHDSSFHLTMVLRFPECHTFGIIRYVAFTDQFHSLSEVHLKFPHVSSWLESSLPFS